MQSFKEFVESCPPPGMDQWMQSNKQAFIDQHGPNEYEAFLLSAAWTLYRKIYRDSEVFSQ